MFIHRLFGRLGPQYLLRVARHLSGEFLVSGDVRLTRRQLFDRADSLAAGLQALGVRKGDRVATLLPACAEAVYAMLLPWALGTVEVPLDPGLGEDALCRILSASGAKMVLTTRSWQGRDLAGLVAGLRPRLPSLRYVLARERGGRGGAAAFSIEGLIASGAALWRASVSVDEVGHIAHTSGVTGRPKGVVHRRGAYWALARPAVRPWLEDLAGDCLLLAFPPYRYPGRLGIVAALLAGAKVVLCDDSSTERLPALIRRERVTRLCAPPAIYRRLLEVPEQVGDDLSTVRRAMLTGEACPRGLAETIHGRLDCSLESFYWTTESGLITWSGRDDSWERAVATVGRPAPGVEVRVVDGSRQPLPAGEEGEVAVRSRQMMVGYHEDPAATASALDREGWFYTGDLGTLDDEGCLRLSGRL